MEATKTALNRKVNGKKKGDSQLSNTAMNANSWGGKRKVRIFLLEQDTELCGV